MDGEPEDHALGVSRGGWSTKVHAAVDAACGMLAGVLTAGQAADGPMMIPVLDKIRVQRPAGGRPRTRPQMVLADKAYSSRANRAWLRAHHIAAIIPVKVDQAAHRKARGRLGGRPPAFDPTAYKDRNTVERCFGQLKQNRAMATRYDKLAVRYLATTHIASIDHWLKRLTQHALGGLFMGCM
ncbi:IS5 family transposase [Actinomyces ruminicola]|uniref:Transposase DDE domain-containing protein n=1 Tax=Actinomyces ruminicola TaxID=332524 RepID=A0A1H0ABI1_9ACTO|nr:IS5 family transposase [Actinomyces ruminicola]SDN30910.1 Transposase DDE domain-containing protein [Actinomyces ruminicola]